MVKKTAHEKRRRLVIIIVAVIVAGVATALVAAAVIMFNREDTSTDNTLQDGSIVTVDGKYECLPKAGDGPQTLECAAGILVDDGKHYGIELPGLRAKSGSGGNPLGDYYKVGKRLRITGVFRAESQSTYQSSGTIETETVEPLK